jgi:hypothetical protein
MQLSFPADVAPRRHRRLLPPTSLPLDHPLQNMPQSVPVEEGLRHHHRHPFQNCVTSSWTRHSNGTAASSSMNPAFEGSTSNDAAIISGGSGALSSSSFSIGTMVGGGDLESAAPHRHNNYRHSRMSSDGSSSSRRQLAAFPEVVQGPRHCQYCHCCC